MLEYKPFSPRFHHVIRTIFKNRIKSSVGILIHRRKLQLENNINTRRANECQKTRSGCLPGVRNGLDGPEATVSCLFSLTGLTPTTDYQMYRAATEIVQVFGRNPVLLKCFKIPGLQKVLLNWIISKPSLPLTYKI